MTRLIVIGGSAGALQPLLQIAASLPTDAAVLVTLHIGAKPSELPALLASRGPLPAAFAVDGEPLQPGRIAVAPPDRHLLVMGEQLSVWRGPKENYSRPAIDPLFRSAALAHGRDVIGVVLSGDLDDGSAGLQAVKAMGGIAVVQDPTDAAHPSMPLSARRHVPVDHSVAAEAIGPLLAHLSAAPPPPWRASDEAQQRRTVMAAEQNLLTGEGDPLAELQRLGQPSTFTCPECHGALWQMDGTHPLRFRCHTGHGFTLRSLQHVLSDRLEDSLWSAVRTLQENALVLRELARQSDEASPAREDPEAIAGRLIAQADALRGLIAQDAVERRPDAEAHPG